jgi:hypothetical protein
MAGYGTTPINVIENPIKEAKMDIVNRSMILL